METFLPEAVNTWDIIVVGSPWPLIGTYLVVINLIALLMMWSDKRRSKKDGTRRISEKALFLSAILGGSVGAILGMRLFPPQDPALVLCLGHAGDSPAPAGTWGVGMAYILFFVNKEKYKKKNFLPRNHVSPG